MRIKNEGEKKKFQNIGVKIAKVVFYGWGIKKARFAPNVRLELKLVQKQHRPKKKKKLLKKFLIHCDSKRKR